MKNTAIKIVSGVLVVALVVVAALAIAGVFSTRTTNEVAFAEGDASVNEQHMFRNFDASTVLYIRSVDGSEVNGTPDTFIHVVDNAYKKVIMTKDTVKDANGNIGLKPEDGWKEGMFYSVSLAAGYEFVNEEYEGLDSFMCIVAARESTDADTKVKDSVIMLEAGKFSVAQNEVDSTKYTLTVEGSAPAGEDLVFVYNDGLKSQAYRKAQNVGKVVANGNSYTLTVEQADVSDVYEYIYVNKSYDVQKDDIQFDLEATEASLRQSDWFLAATRYLYGEEYLDGDKEGKKKVEVKFDPGFTPGTPSKVTLNITIKFNVFDDGKGSIVVKIANTLTPVFDVHVQDNEGGKSFDVSLDMDVETTATLEASYANSWSSLDEKGNKLTDIANGLASLVKKVTSEKLGSPDKAKPYTFAKWIIPIGTLPICVEDSLGFELGASFAGEVGALATNKFHATFGVVYAGGSLQSYHNIDDKFHFDNVTMAGTAGAKVGLFNEVGISAYGTISINLGIHAGVYADVAGRLSLSGDDLIALFKNEKSLNIVPAYYFETGIYASIDANGKVFGFNIASFTLLNKKFPLYQAGHKYLPMSFIETEDSDKIYMQNSYFYVVGWDVNALDIQSIGSAATARNLAWSEFDYTVGPNLRMEGNVVYATTADEFESYITVTSKVNKDLSKTITIIKNPEGPTTTQAEQVFDRAYPTDGYWMVMLNASKFLGVTLDGTPLLDTQYSYSGDTLAIDQYVLNGLSYGAHSVVVESSKGYLKLVVRVINSANVEVEDSLKVFDKAAPSAVVWDMQLQGNDVVSVVEDSANVSAKCFNYRESVGQFAILASYWDAKEVGSYTETVTLSSGDVITLSVVVKDTRAAKMNTASYEYVVGSNAKLALDVEAFDNAANVVSAVALEGTSVPTDEAVVPAALLENLAVGSYQGTVTVGGEALAFTVNVVSSTESLIVPVKKKVFYKSSAEDVVFQAKIPSGANVSIVGAEGGYEVGAASITIKADFLRAKKGTEWEGTVTAGSSSVKLVVSLVNDVLPALAGDTFGSNNDNAISVEWNLQEVALADVIIEGLAAEQYAKSNDRLTVYPAGLGYGANVVTVYTPVNTMSFTINREGKPSVSANCTVNKKEAEVAEYALDVAHLGFSYVTVDNATILASSYRYNAGVLTLANEFVYNLAEGTYTVHVHLSDESVLDTTLTVQGDIKDVNSVGHGSYGAPYLIYTAEQLAGVASFVNQGNANACYKLMADIDMFGKTLTPIGDADHPYNGTFFGNGYTISNLTISEPVKVDKDGYAIGMFGVVGTDGCVQDLRLNGAKVSFAKSGSVSAGIVVGRNAGNVENITVSDGSITAESKSWLDIKNAYFDLGAVVGYNNGGVIRSVSVEANIQGKVKGLNVLGIQIGGRKSLINAGAVVGYFTTTEEGRRLVKNIQVTASISCDADNNSVNNNGWYGYTDLSEEEIAACIKRVSLFNK